MLTAPLGAWLSHQIPEPVLLVLFGVLMLLIALRMWLKADRQGARGRIPADFRQRRTELPSRSQRRTQDSLPAARLLLAAVGLSTGVLTGLFGVSGGFLIVPALVAFSGMGMQRAIGTSLFVITLVSLSGIAGHFMTGGSVPWEITLLFLLGSLAGMFGRYGDRRSFGWTASATSIRSCHRRCRRFRYHSQCLELNDEFGILLGVSIRIPSYSCRKKRKAATMKLLIVGGVAGGASAALVPAACRKTPRSSCSSGGRTCRSPTAACPTTSAARSPSGTSCWSRRPSGCAPASTSTCEPGRRSRPSTAPRRQVRVRDLASGREYEESYDKLILAPGAAPLRPPIPGIDLPGIFTLRNLQDVDRIKERVDQGVQQAVVVGAGFIGLELVENFVRRGIATTVVELQDQVLPPFDKEMTTPIAEALLANKVDCAARPVRRGVRAAPDGLIVRLKSGQRLPAQLVILGVGVRPENKLAVDAGLEVGPRGGIRVNEHLQTSDPDIYAVGDAIEVKDFVSGDPTQVPLAGPANRQGRIAADNIFGRSVAIPGNAGNGHRAACSTGRRR